MQKFPPFARDANERRNCQCGLTKFFKCSSRNTTSFTLSVDLFENFLCLSINIWTSKNWDFDNRWTACSILNIFGQIKNSRLSQWHSKARCKIRLKILSDRLFDRHFSTYTGKFSIIHIAGTCHFCMTGLVVLCIELTRLKTFILALLNYTREGCEIC